MGLDVGLLVGELVGFDVGDDVGFDVGLEVGCKVGLDVGLDVGLLVGEQVSFDVELEVGCEIGLEVGLDVSWMVGEPVGLMLVATSDSRLVGMLVVALMQLGPASAQLEFALERRRNWSLPVLGQRGQVFERFYSVLEGLELALEQRGLPLAQLEQRTVSRE